MALRIVPATVLVAILIALPLRPASAQTWTGAAGDGNWNTAGNWSTGMVPTSPTSAVLFGATGAGTVNLTNNTYAGSIIFDNVNAGSYTLTSNPGGTLNLLTGMTYGTNIFTSNGATQTINLAYQAAGNLLLTGPGPLTFININGSGGGLVIGPNTVISAPGSAGVVFACNGNTTMSGSFAAGSGGVTGGLTKTGLGTLEYSGDGTQLQGGLTLNGGTFILDYAANPAPKLGSGNLTLSGGTLQLAANATDVTQTVAGTVLVGGHTNIVAMGPNTMTNVTLNMGAIGRSPGATADFSSNGPTANYLEAVS